MALAHPRRRAGAGRPRRLAAAACLCLCAWQAFAGVDPRADPRAVVTDGDVRFTVLTSRLLRLEHVPEGSTFEDRASLAFVNRRLAVPDFEVRKDERQLEILTGDLSLRYERGSGAFGPDNLSIELRVDGADVTWHPGMPNTGNLLGTTRTLDGFEGPVRAADGTRLVLEPGILSRDGWSVIDDSGRPVFTTGDDGPWVAARARNAGQDWYFFGYGHDYKGALGDFVKVAGRIPMPPRFAFGYWWSRYWVYSDADLRELVKTMSDYGIPLDVLVVDMDWHRTYGLNSKTPHKTPFGGMLGWTGYTWNRALFPDPEAFLRWTEERSLKVALNLHPSDGVAPFEDGYEAMVDTLGGKTGPDGWLEYRLADERWAEAWFEHMLRPKERIGVDFWWLDWQQQLQSDVVRGLSNTFWLNHVFFTDMEREYPDRRPLLFHRWGGLGNHRYQVGFSGDAVISWDSLRYQPYFTATASNVGYGYWSHDIGGHIVEDAAAAADGELYLRWLQFGALSPILRTHASKSGTAERAIWKYPVYFPMMRDAIRLRYRLAPYLYTAARVAYDTGVSMIRPMYYDYPAHDAAYRAPAQYMLGPSLIVAPVTSPVDEAGLAAQSIWLPPGQWYEWASGTLLEGGRRITRTFGLAEMPIYVRAGSVLPLYPEKTSNLQQAADRMVLRILPGEGSTSRYYEDAGDTQAYERGRFAWMTVSVSERADRLEVTVSPAAGSYAGQPAKRAFTLEIPMILPARRITLDGRELPAESASYDAAAVRQTIDTGFLPAGEPFTVTVYYHREWQRQRSLLEGKRGLFGRLSAMGARLKRLAARDDWAATIPQPVLELIETPSRIRYEPDRIVEHLEAFDRLLPGLEAELEAMPQIDAEEARALAGFVLDR